MNRAAGGLRLYQMGGWFSCLRFGGRVAVGGIQLEYVSIVGVGSSGCLSILSGWVWVSINVK